MRLIGVLGGMSWESTAEYYRLFNGEVRRRLGGLHSANLLVRSIDFAEIETLQSSGEWERAGEILASEAVALEAGGAELLVLATNTMHTVVDAIEARCSVPLLHIGDTTAAAVRAAGVQRVGLLGTAFTMEQHFYVDRLRVHGLGVVTPPAADREVVHRVIYDELCRGQVLETSRAAYLDIIGRLVGQGCTGVILGCTEIELLLPMDQAHGVPLFPTTRIHVAAAVDAAL
jgi:aspartate racemase